MTNTEKLKQKIEEMQQTIKEMTESLDNAKKTAIWAKEEIAKMREHEIIRVPENIGIYARWSDDEKRNLLIGFNCDKQLLGVHSKVFFVDTFVTGLFKKVPCKLTPCKREDLKTGDTAFVSKTFLLDDSMLSDNVRYVKIIGNQAIKINKIGEIIYDKDFHNYWYKVEPI